MRYVENFIIISRSGCSVIISTDPQQTDKALMMSDPPACARLGWPAERSHLPGCVPWNRLDSEACFECQLPPSINSGTASTHSVAAAAAAIVSRPFRCRRERKKSPGASHINDIPLSSFATEGALSSCRSPSVPSSSQCNSLERFGNENCPKS